MMNATEFSAPTLKAKDFAAMLEGQMPQLRRYAINRCQDHALADDLVQETLLKAWSNRDKFTPGTNFGGWLSVILKNSHLNYVRKHAREQIGIDEQSSDMPTVSSHQDHSCELADVARAFDMLAQEHKSVLLSVAVSGDDYETAAQRHGCAVGTVKSRLSRARKILRNSVETTTGLPGFEGGERSLKAFSNALAH